VLSLNPGGTERLVVELAARLHAEMPMMVCCLDEAGAWARELESRGIAVRTLGRRAGFRPALGGAIAAIAREHRASVIHAHHYSPFVYSAIARVRGAGAHVVFTEHGRLSDARPSVKRRLANRALAAVPRAVFAVSEDLKAHMVAEGFAAGAVRVIYNGIDVGPLPEPDDRARARRQLGVSDDVFVVGTIARLDPVKDLQTLVAAAARFIDERPAVPMLVAVIGDGAERRSLERAAAAGAAARCVRFLGHRDDARAWLAGCDVYVNSSISEGVSLTILEAMAAGLPVVATGVGGTPEVVTPDSGRLVPARDPSALAAALCELADAPSLGRELGRTARARVESRFTLDRMVREYRDVYAAVSASEPR
jgi:glycosyltransferase involved in cell wall biosynthesis